MERNALVIGATGLLGYGVSIELQKRGWNVKALGRESLIETNLFPKGIQYECGDFYDDIFLTNALKKTDKVFFFLSSTFPSTSSDSLELEINRTLKGLDYLMRKMKELDIPAIVFPSSGGTVYGNVTIGAAKEEDQLKPTTPYGYGKKMCEDILRFYSKFGISSTILRVGNVYGTPMLRTATQGVIDVFIQKAMMGETATVWGNALTDVRDYIFTDDFAEAVALIAGYDADGCEVYNLSSGIGTTLGQIIEAINKSVQPKLNIQTIEKDSASDIKRIVLDMTKFCGKTGWSAKYDIEQGIKETIKRKEKTNRL